MCSGFKFAQAAANFFKLMINYTFFLSEMHQYVSFA